MPPVIAHRRIPQAAAWFLSLGATVMVSAMTGPDSPTPSISSQSSSSSSSQATTGDPASPPPGSPGIVLQLLTTPPPPGSLRPSGGLEPEWQVLHEAYRQDLKNMDLKPPVFLNQDAALHIARELQMGVDIHVVVPTANSLNRPVLEVGARINEGQKDPSSPYLLLCDQGHYSLLLPLGGPPEGIGYYLLEGGVPKGYAEVTVATGQDPEAPHSRVPADGNCLITSLFFLKHGRFPDPARTAELREVVARELNDEQVADALAAMRSDLIWNAGERPFERETFTGYGPLSSHLLRTKDQDFMERRGQVLEGHRKFAAMAEESGRAWLARQEPAGENKGEAPPAPAARDLIAAYRHDLLNGVPPTLLGTDLVEDLAEVFGNIGLPLGQVTPGALRHGKPVFMETELINPKQVDHCDPVVLVVHDGHFKVLEMLGNPGRNKKADYYTIDDGLQGYREKRYRPATGSGLTGVPVDGNSLINGIFAIRGGRFPGPDEIAAARFALNEVLDDEGVLVLVENLREDLRRLSAKGRPSAGDCPGCGPRTFALLAADPALKAPGLPESKGPRGPVESKREAGPGGAFMDEREDEEEALERAIALSLRGPGPEDGERK